LTILQQPYSAAECWLQAYELEPQIVTAEKYFDLGNTLLKSEQFEKAISAYWKTIQLNPNWAEAYQNLAAALQRAGSLQEATICYRQAIELKAQRVQTSTSPQDTVAAARPEFFNGNNLAIQSNASEIQTDRHFLEIQPHHPDIYLQLGDTLVSQNRPDEAISVYKTAMQLFPDNPEIYLYLGQALAAKNDRVGAMAAYRRAIALDPNHYWSHHHLGDILAAQGKFSDAIACYHRAIETNPSPSFWHYHNLGTVQGNHGEWEAAIVSYCNAIELNPNYSWSHKNLGDILAAQGKINEAIVCYRRAIKLKPRIS
jgi:tetratricopeptide (TPR) repeat protein